MPRVDLVVESKIKKTSRGSQLEGMFDVPCADISRMEWHSDIPIDEKEWSVGLIVGPSGSGKTSIARDLFRGHFHPAVTWREDVPVIDAFDQGLSIEEISTACSSVGFNTIPAWLRPFPVLSNGEKFRVDLARRLLELPSPIVVDEFTSVVDRDVAKVGAYAVQKYARKMKKQFVAVSCHYDVVDWLQPDWTFEPATGTFHWRSLRRRPELECEIARVEYPAWEVFAPYHYMTNNLHNAAACYVLFVNGNPAAFTGILHWPNPHSKNLKSCSRLVTLPDWQGLGLAFVLIEFVAACYKALGFRMMTHPAHPPFIRSFDRSPKWAMKRKPGQYQKTNPAGLAGMNKTARPSATFEYAGEAEAREIAERLILDSTVRVDRGKRSALEK